MEVAVRSFVGDVSRFLNCSLSGGGTGGWETRYRQQLEQLRRQLQQLLLRYPSLRSTGSDGDDDNWYDDTDVIQEYDDAGGAREIAQEAVYDDTDSPVTSELTYEEPPAPQEEYDDLWPTSAPVEEPEYDDTAPFQPIAEPYLPMGGKAARTLGISEQHLLPDKRTPTDSLSALAAADPEVTSIQSEASQESLQAEQVPAGQLCSAARRWGRLQLRQESKLWSSQYRPYWTGLVDGRLYLYRRETDAAQKRTINLSGYEVRQPPPGADVNAKRRPSCFELVKPGGKTHQLLALTPKDARQWMAALEAEGVLAGTGDREPNEEPPPRPPPPAAASAFDPALAAAAAAAAVSVPIKQPAETPPADVAEDLYYVPDEDDERIYEDISISWPAGGPPRPPSWAQTSRVSADEGEIYDTVDTPSGVPPEPSWPAPALPRPARLALGRPGALPAVPGQLNAESPGSPPPPPLPDRAPLEPAGQPPSQPPPPPQRDPGIRPVPVASPPAQPPPPPPQRGLAAPTLPPPPSQRAPTGPAYPPRLPARQERVRSPSPVVIEEELYDELADVSGQPALPPPSDPFYNVLEPEYLQPRHPSPVPIKTPDEPPDEGYGNSSGGSENDCHPPQAEEGHYKILPNRLRPVRPVGAPATPVNSTEKGGSPALPIAKNGRTSAPSITKDGGTSAPSTAAAADRPTRLAGGSRPRAGTAGADGSRATGSVSEVIRRLNRQSVGDEEPAASRPAPRQLTTPVSADLARKQALIADGLRAMSPVKQPSKPTVLPPKPAGGKPKPKLATPARREASPAGYGSAGGSGARPAAGLVPNKSAVYKTMQRMSDSENRAISQASQRALSGQPAAIEPEEDDVYAEIDEDSWRT